MEKFEHGRAAHIVDGIRVDEPSVLVILGDTELNRETPDNVGSTHCCRGFQLNDIFFHTFNDGFKIIDLWS